MTITPQNPTQPQPQHSQPQQQELALTTSPIVFTSMPLRSTLLGRRRGRLRLSIPRRSTSHARIFARRVESSRWILLDARYHLNINTPCQHTLSTLLNNTPCTHTLSTLLNNRPCTHTLSTLLKNRPCTHTLSTLLNNRPCQHTLSTHSINTPCQHNLTTHLSTHSINPHTPQLLHHLAPQDIDDAMSVTFVREGWIEVAVSIADVCAFVAQDSALDREAQVATQPLPRYTKQTNQPTNQPTNPNT